MSTLQTAQTRPARRFLFTNWEGGGHVDPALRVARQCIRLGHAVLFVSDEADRQAAASLGVPFTSWTSAPNRSRLGDEAADLRDWVARTPLGAIDAICRRVVIGPAEAYARDTTELIASFAPDMVVSNELLFGCIIAAERAGVPCALVTGNLWCFPTRSDVPPFGPGFRRSKSQYALGRDLWTSRIVQWLFNRHTRDLNAVRERLGSPPLAAFLDQLCVPRTVVLGASRAFDIGTDTPPDGFFYSGPLIHAPVWADQPCDLLKPASGPRAAPLVLVSFSTTPQGQRGAVVRCIRALARMPVRAIVTLGPAVKEQGLPRAANVQIVASASHDELMPLCAAMICHAGHGTLIRPILHGVPVVCMPMGRDQADNSARIVEHGAGLRLSPRASVSRIRKAVDALLQDTAFRDKARRLGEAIRAEIDDGEKAARHLAWHASHYAQRVQSSLDGDRARVAVRAG